MGIRRDFAGLSQGCRSTRAGGRRTRRELLDDEGTWEGSVAAEGKVRRIALQLAAAADGTAKATLISVDTGNLEIPVTTVTLRGKELELQARAVGGTYRGTLGDAGEIVGEWIEATSRLPLTFKRGDSK